MVTNILVFLLILALVAGYLVYSRQLSLLVCSLLVMLTGVVFGHAWFNLDVGPLPITFDRIMWAGLVLTLVWFWKNGWTRPQPLRKTDVVVATLAMVLIVSTLLHDWQYKDNLPLSRLLFFNLIPIGFYFIARHCHITTRHLKVFYGVVACFGFYLALTAILEQREYYAFVFPGYITDPDNYEFLGRARGPFLNPVPCGIFLTVCLVCTSFLLPESRRVDLAWIVPAIGLIVVASFLTLTRSVWVGCLGAIGIITWLPATQRMRGALVVAGTLMLLVTALSFGDRINYFQRDKNVSVEHMAKSASLRPMLAYVAIKMAEDKPIFGHGFGQYTAAKKPYHYADTNNMELSRILGYMQHNVVLSYLTETGLVGVTLLLFLFGSLIWHSWLLWRSRSLDLAERQWGLLGMAFACAWLVNGMFHDVSIIAHIGTLFYLLLGATVNLASRKVLTVPAQANVTDDIAESPALAA